MTKQVLSIRSSVRNSSGPERLIQNDLRIPFTPWCMKARIKLAKCDSSDYIIRNRTADLVGATDGWMRGDLAGPRIQSPSACIFMPWRLFSLMAMRVFFNIISWVCATYRATYRATYIYCATHFSYCNTCTQNTLHQDRSSWLRPCTATQ